MNKLIELNNLESHMFMSDCNKNINFNKNKTEVYGKNGSGKTTIANAFCWAFTGTGFWGEKINPFFNNNPTTWVKLNYVDDDGYKQGRRTSEKSKTVKNISTITSELDKELFLSIVNPRYFLSLNPTNAKDVLGKIINKNYLMLETNEQLSKDVAILLNKKENNYMRFSIKQRLDDVEKTKKEISDLIKEKDKLVAMENGKLEGLEQTKAIFEDNGVALTEKQLELLEVNRCVIEHSKADLTKDKEELAKDKKLLDAYRNSLIVGITNEFNLKSKFTEISLIEDNKDVFIVKYKGKNIKSCSNSEQLDCGLDIVNTIMDLSEIIYPVFIDNAEASLNISMKNYPLIEQLIVLSVSDVDLSIYNNGELKSIETGECMKRTRESLKPTYVTLGGWGD